MKTFERVLFLLAFLFIDIYTTRHIYQLWLAPTGSVLDEFNDETQNAIDSANDITSLLAKYRPARATVKRIEHQNVGKPPEEWRFDDQEPFKTEASLRSAIEEWEAKQREVFEMRVYWIFGLFGAIAGAFIYAKKSRWLGLAFMITGFAEMIWWCSPSWINRATAETERLLANKVALSVMTLLFLVAGARTLGLLKNPDDRNAALPAA